MTVMTATHNIICGGLSLKGINKDINSIELNLWDMSKAWNLNMLLDAVQDRFLTFPSDRFLDFIEIATYIWCSDQCITRGGLKDVDQFGAAWRRDLSYHIPVRCLDFWNDPDVKQQLINTLDFLSDDFYAFSFYQAVKPPDMQLYFKASGLESTAKKPEQVVMFSGGLDSLGGAIQESIKERRQIILVNHRSTKKLNTTHKLLNAQLAEAAGRFAPLHLHVDVSKKIKSHNKETTQRSRSFLFAALGATVASMLEQDSVKFYENGVVSLNLPISAQTVGSRSTRTTHPRVIHDYGVLISMIADRPFKIENPYIYKTRGEIIQSIVNAGCEEFIKNSMSCAHTWQSTKIGTHCGKCSQCLDRRLGMFAVDAEKYDPEVIYRENVFTKGFTKDEDKLLIASFLERANNIRSLEDETAFLLKYPNLPRALRYLDSDLPTSLSRCFELYKRHAGEVKKAAAKMLALHSEALLERTLPKNCMVRIISDPVMPSVVSCSGQALKNNNEPTGLESSEVEGQSIVSSQLDELKKHLDRRFDSLGAEYSSLKEENTALKADLASAILCFSQNVEPEFFTWIIHVLACGSIRAAATELDIPNSSFAKNLKSYAARGGKYELLYNATILRRKIGRRSIESYNDLFAGHQPESLPDRSIVESVLEGLEALSGSNWESVRDELIEIVKEGL